MNIAITTGAIMRRDYPSHALAEHVFEIKRPAACSITQLHYFYVLLKKGNKVSPVNLPEKIMSAEFLGFCYEDKQLVGISAIKRPQQDYLLAVHQKAGIRHSLDNRLFELGYSFTLEHARRRGISSTLKTLLLNKIAQQQGIIFSTTATPTSQRFLKNNGFRAFGKPYEGIYDHDIVYFEKALARW